VRLNAAVQRVSAAGTGVRLDLQTPSGPQRAEAQVLLVAAGRRPNSGLLGLAAAGVEVDARGYWVCLLTAFRPIFCLDSVAPNRRHLVPTEAYSSARQPACHGRVDSAVSSSRLKPPGILSCTRRPAVTEPSGTAIPSRR
jgi:hypothetical protein